jgi:hypothetical protein
MREHQRQSKVPNQEFGDFVATDSVVLDEIEVAKDLKRNQNDAHDDDLIDALTMSAGVWIIFFLLIHMFLQ